MEIKMDGNRWYLLLSKLNTVGKIGICVLSPDKTIRAVDEEHTAMMEVAVPDEWPSEWPKVPVLISEWQENLSHMKPHLKGLRFINLFIDEGANETEDNSEWNFADGARYPERIEWNTSMTPKMPKLNMDFGMTIEAYDMLSTLKYLSEFTTRVMLESSLVVDEAWKDSPLVPRLEMTIMDGLNVGLQLKRIFQDSGTRNPKPLEGTMKSRYNIEKLTQFVKTTRNETLWMAFASDYPLLFKQTYVYPRYSFLLAPLIDE